MSNPTTPFSWQMPTNTDLVTDLPADFEVFGQAVATSMADLLGGTSGQILAKNSNTDMDFVWVANDQGDITGVTAGTGISGGGTSGTVTVTNSMATAIDAKGDLIAGTGADAFSRLAIGTNDQVLTADSAEATGMKWATAAGGGKPTFQAYKSGSTQNLSANTTTKVTFQSESWDTNGNFASSTFTPTVAGYYQFNVCLNWEPTAAATLRVLSYKNGSAYQNLNGLRANAGETYYPAHGLVYLNGTTDTLEIYANSSTTSSIYQSDASVTYFNAAGANS